jgi:NAD(P)-dependent dehydrogenase (short-subunit alcohol dehydrogenase family)
MPPPPASLFDLTGKVAFVTGAGRGLGRAIALGLAGAGADVAGAARTPGELATLAAEVRALGRAASAHPMDIRSSADVERAVAEAVEAHGRIDILVNNAGAKVPQDAVDVTDDAWDLVLGTNLKGAFFCAQAVARGMLAQGSGKIINIASTYSVVGAPGRATYAASKGGLLQLTKVMAIEWAARNIHVNAIGPTAALTPMNDDVLADEQSRRAALAKIPAGRFCEPEDIVGPAIFLASRASDMVHGHLLLVDGGLTAL